MLHFCMKHFFVLAYKGPGMFVTTDDPIKAPYNVNSIVDLKVLTILKSHLTLGRKFHSGTQVFIGQPRESFPSGPSFIPSGQNMA